MTAILKKEIKSYFNDLTGYLFISAFVLSFCIIFLKDCLFAGKNVLPDVFLSVSSILILMTPLLTVQMFTMERRQNTWTLLTSSNMSMSAIVLGKFFAAAALMAVCVLSTWIDALVLSLYTQVYVGELICCQIGLFLLGSVYIAVGELISAICRRRLTAAAITIFSLFLTGLAGSSVIAADSGILSNILGVLSPYIFFSRFCRGVFSISSVLFLMVYTAVCLMLTVRCVEYGRIKGV